MRLCEIEREGVFKMWSALLIEGVNSGVKNADRGLMVKVKVGELRRVWQIP